MITSFILKGHGIYQVAAMSGTHKSGIAYELEQKYLDSGMARIEKSMEKLVSKGRLSSEDVESMTSLRICHAYKAITQLIL
jgi:3-hydroxyacyl-CoA dehydrogenase